MANKLTVTRGSGARTHGGVAKGKIDLTLSGPMFEKDPGATLTANIRRMNEGLAREGQQATRAASPRKTGYFADGIVGRVDSLSGKPWMFTAIISQTRVWPWEHKGARGFVGRAEAQYRGGRTEAKYHPFRRVANALRRSRKINVAELLKGIAE